MLENNPCWGSNLNLSMPQFSLHIKWNLQFLMKMSGSLTLLFCRNSLAVQWLGLCAFTVEGTGSIPGWITKILQVVEPDKKKKKKKKTTHYCFESFNLIR